MYYVGLDDGAHHDMYFESNSLFETLCEYYDAMNTLTDSHYEQIEWGTFTDDEINCEDYHDF